MHLFNQGIPPPRGLSPLVCREKPQENPRRTQEQSKRRRIRAEEADSRRRGGRFRAQRSSIAVGVEKGGQAEEAFALCRRGYSWIQGAEEGDSRRRGGGFKAHRSSIAVGVEKGGQAEEAFAACRRGYSSAAFYVAGTTEIGVFWSPSILPQSIYPI